MQPADMIHLAAINRLISRGEQRNLILTPGFSQKLFAVAHDIQSPLTALSILAQVCDELDEEKRFMLTHCVERIQEMMKGILDEYKNKNSQKNFDEQQQTILCPEIIDQILSEKKYQYLRSGVTFKKTVSQPGSAASIRVQPNQLKRAISNVINNAVDAVAGKKNGAVAVHIDADDHSVTISVSDNGKGMTKQMLEKMAQKISFTEGKQDGHGLGMTQVWDMLESNSGKLDIRSTQRAGTQFNMVFPKVHT